MPEKNDILIETCSSLAPALINATEALVRRCSEFDGFAQEIEDDSALNIDKSMPSWILARSGTALLGVATLFAPSRDEVEVYAWTDPEFRCHGVFTAMAEKAEEIAGEFGFPAILYCPDGKSGPGAKAAESRGAQYRFSEYLMAAKLADMRLFPVSIPGFSVRVSIPQDIDQLIEASMLAFGDSGETARSMIEAGMPQETTKEVQALQGSSRADREAAKNLILVAMNAPARRQYTALLDGRVIGMCATSPETSTESGDLPGGKTAGPDKDQATRTGTADTVMINGLGVIPEFRGQGFGRAILREVLRLTQTGGVTIARLEVDSSNVTALNLYKGEGFQEIGRTDYFHAALAVPGQ